MFIDAHAHITTTKMTGYENTSLATLSVIMKENKISYAVISNLDAIETEPFGKGYRLISEPTKAQVKLSQELLDLTKDKKEFIVVPWCRPHAEGLTEEFKAFLTENIDRIKGLKFHPFHSKMKITNNKVKPYLEFAAKYHLPVLVHCAIDKYSRAKYVYKLARKYPKITFIMAHLELMAEDYKKPIRYLLKCDNLFADTAWLNVEEVIKIINLGGEDKIIFGTDAPIDGLNHYSKYKDYFSPQLNMRISLEAYQKLMYKNATYVYKL